MSLTSNDKEYPFVLLESPIPSLPPPNSLCTPIFLTGGAVLGAGETLMKCKHCSEVAKPLMCYQHCFANRPKPQHLTWRNLTLSQIKSVQVGKIKLIRKIFLFCVFTQIQNLHKHTYSTVTLRLFYLQFCLACVAFFSTWKWNLR